MATQLTKQAHFNDRRGEVALQADSYGGWRGTLDQSYGVDRFAIRLNGLLADRKGYQNDTWDRTNAFHVAASFKLTDSTQVRAEVERHAEHALLWRKLYAEQASLWNRTTFNENNSTIANPNSFGIEQVSGSTIPATSTAAAVSAIRCYGMAAPTCLISRAHLRKSSTSAPRTQP
jgi:hypothetical protein